MTSPASSAIARSGRAGPLVPAVLTDRIGDIATWSVDRVSTGARRWLQIALGLLWLLDAALQFQPYMFSRAFAIKILSASAVGSPWPVAGPVRAASQLMLHNLVAWNAAFATMQLALAVGLLWRPAVRAALAGTVVWSLAVWWLGESLGGILAGAASPLSGAPGAVILYALVALLAWPARTRGRQHATVADGSPLGARWSRMLWLVLWSSYAYLILQAPNRAPGALRASIVGLAAGEPRWIAAMDRGAATAAGHAGILIPILAAAAFALIGGAIFLPAAARPTLTLSIILALAIWAIGENFGGILTGQATDPNTGPILVLVTFAFWPLSIPGEMPAQRRRSIRVPPADGRAVGRDLGQVPSAATARVKKRRAARGPAPRPTKLRSISPDL